MLTRFWKIGAGVIFCLICCAILLSKAQSKASAEKLVGNTTYFTGSSDVPKLTLINGSRTAYYGRLHVSLNVEGHFCFGDFNRDGLRDAAIVIFENEGGNLDGYSLAFLINDGTRLIHKKSVHLDFWAVINSVRERSGKVVVDMFVHQEGDCNAGPTKRVKRVFDYQKLGPGTLVPIVQRSEWAPSEADLRYVSRNQEMQDILDTHIPERLRKTFDRQANALFARKFMVIEMVPVDPGGFQAVILFDGVPQPFRVRFVTLKNEYILRGMEELLVPIGEMFLDETQSLAYERFWQ